MTPSRNATGRREPRRVESPFVEQFDAWTGEDEGPDAVTACCAKGSRIPTARRAASASMATMTVGRSPTRSSCPSRWICQLWIRHRDSNGVVTDSGATGVLVSPATRADRRARAPQHASATAQSAGDQGSHCRPRDAGTRSAPMSRSARCGPRSRGGCRRAGHQDDAGRSGLCAADARHARRRQDVPSPRRREAVLLGRRVVRPPRDREASAAADARRRHRLHLGLSQGSRERREPAARIGRADRGGVDATAHELLGGRLPGSERIAGLGQRRRRAAPRRHPRHGAADDDAGVAGDA